MGQRIFINYRRSDSAAIVGRIDDHLRNAFGDNNVFRDLESIPVGMDFATHIRSKLAECDAFLVVIGNSWDTNRLKRKEDWVRMEIEEALKLQMLIIPVLVEGASLPSAASLPKSIRQFTQKNAVYIDSGTGFRDQVYKLIAGIREGFQRRGSREETVEGKLRENAMLGYDRILNAADEPERRKMQELATRFQLHALNQAMPGTEHSVSKVKLGLESLGFFEGEINDDYTGEFFDAVAAFQRAVGLIPDDGIFGKDTFLELMRRLFPEKVSQGKS